MKHKKKNRILSRERSQRLSLLRGLAHDLLLHGSLTTTKPKALELRRYFEPLVTTARKGLTQHSRRRLQKFLREAEDIRRLEKVAKTQQHRPGGYVRITRLPTKREDNAPLARIDIIDQDVAK